MSVKNHPTTETKKPKLHGECWNSFGFLVFWFFGFLVFWFFRSLVFWFFGSLFFWFLGVFLKYNLLHNKTKQPKNQKTKEPKNQKTKEPKNQKTKTVPAFSVELWFFGFLVSVVGWFFTDTFGGLKVDTPEKARTRRWERCFEGRGLSWGGGGVTIYIYIYIYICLCVYMFVKYAACKHISVLYIYSEHTCICTCIGTDVSMNS